MEAEVHGIPVTILDVSLGGVGGMVEFKTRGKQLPPLGSETMIEFRPEGGPAFFIPVEITRLSKDADKFGAHFTELGNWEYLAMERLSMGRPMPKAKNQK